MWMRCRCVWECEQICGLRGDRRLPSSCERTRVACAHIGDKIDGNTSCAILGCRGAAHICARRCSHWTVGTLFGYEYVWNIVLHNSPVHAATCLWAVPMKTRTHWPTNTHTNKHTSNHTKLIDNTHARLLVCIKQHSYRGNQIEHIVNRIAGMHFQYYKHEHM